MRVLRIAAAALVAACGCASTEANGQSPATPASTQPGQDSTTKVVLLRIRIGADGTVQTAEVIESAGPSFDQTALKYAYSMRFKPAIVDGHPVPSMVTWKYRFEFEQ